MPNLPYKNILLIRSDRMGDVVLATPAVRALKDACPQARLSMLVSPASRDLIDGLPDLDEILVDDRRGRHRGPVGFWRLVVEVRRRKFDLAVVWYTKRRTNLLCWLAGIPERIGYRNKKYGFLLSRPLTDRRHLGGQHQTEFCLDVIRALGVDVPRRPPAAIVLRPEAEAWADRRLAEPDLRGAPVVAVHPGGSDSLRCWAVEDFTTVIERLASGRGCRIVLIGADNVREAADKIAARSRVPVVNMVGKTSVSEMVGFLSRCRLLISNDSGPVHVADALGIPVVSVFVRNRPGINPERWRPLGPASRCLAPPGESSAPDGAAQRSRQQVSPEAVLAVVDDVFKLC